MAGLYPRSLACSILLSMKASSAGLAVRLVPIRAAYRNGRRGAIQGVGFQTETLPRTLSVPVRGLEFLRRTKNADRWSTFEVRVSPVVCDNGASAETGSGPDWTMPSFLTNSSECGSTASRSNSVCSSGLGPSPHWAAMERNLRKDVML